MESDSAVEQGFINYHSMPSLQSIATVTVVTALCRSPDISNALLQHALKFDPDEELIHGTNYNKGLAELDKSISSKVSLLPLPTSLKAEVITTARAIKLQILRWIRKCKNKKYLDCIRWNIQGTIDKEKTLLELIDKDIYQNVDIYKLVCESCSESCISKVTKQLQSKNPKDYLFNESVNDEYEYLLMAYWISVVKGELPEFFRLLKWNVDGTGMQDSNLNFYRHVFSLSILKGNVMAVKYFWKKLTDEEISLNIMRWIHLVQNRINSSEGFLETNEYSEILYFLLSHLKNTEQQDEIFRRCSCNILKSLFLHWPWQRFLLPTLEMMWDYLEEEVYINFLYRVADAIKEDFSVGTLLRKIWRISLWRLKRCFIQHVLGDIWYNADVFCKLLLTEDLEIIEMLLEGASMEQKKSIFFNVAHSNKLFEVLCRSNFTLLDTLLQNAFDLESDIHDFKQRIIWRHGRKLFQWWICDDNFKMIENFFSWASRSPDQFENFKNETVDKNMIIYSIITEQKDFELADKFLKWCYDSEEEIIEFKKDFGLSRQQIIEISREDWGLLETFVGWCFRSSEDIKVFKLNILESDHLGDVIFDSIIYSHDFEFVDKLFSWCCQSDEEIKKYKGKFAVSDICWEMLQRCVRNCKVRDSKYDNWELTRKFIKLFSPLTETAITRLKKNIKSNIVFQQYKAHSCPAIGRNDLFNFINCASNFSTEYVSSSSSNSDNASCSDDDCEYSE